MDKQQRRENNLKVLASLKDSNANKDHIFSRMRKRFEVMRLVAIFLKRARADRQKAESNIELYLDDWAFQHGTPITKENIGDAVADLVDRVVKQKQVREELAEQSDGDGMKDYPL